MDRTGPSRGMIPPVESRVPWLRNASLAVSLLEVSQQEAVRSEGEEGCGSRAQAVHGV